MADVTDSSASDGTDGVQPAVDSTQTIDKPAPRVVPLDVHKVALDKMHALNERVHAAEKKLSDGESERLKAQENFKGLWERETERADKAIADAKRTTELFINTQRYDKFKDAAVKAGLRPEAIEDLNLLDLSDLPVEATSNNRYLIHGIDVKVEQVKNDRAHWFKKEEAPNVNGAGGGAPLPTNATLTAADVNAAEKAAARGTISYSQYEKTHFRYAKQQEKLKQSG